MDNSSTSNSNPAELIEQAHALYCELTGQKILLRCNWQRSWYELFRWGFTLEDVRCVVGYLQKEIRHERRNIGALKLSNLLQPDRFEEDLNISRARLRSSPPPSAPKPRPPEPEPAEHQEVARQLKRLKHSLRVRPIQRP
jgi:hypothetical protein